MYLKNSMQVYKGNQKCDQISLVGASVGRDYCYIPVRNSHGSICKLAITVLTIYL